MDLDIIQEFKNYQETGVIRDKWVAAFLENNLYILMEVPQEEIFVNIPNIQKWLKENLDPKIWGDEETVEAYQASKGIT